jgi:hypothetical protein
MASSTQNEIGVNVEINPYAVMHGIFRSIENPKRGAVLLAIGFGELHDYSTLDALIPLTSHLSGTEWTNAAFNRQVKTLIEENLVKKLEDSMLGKEEVSFHSLTLLGQIALLYLFIVHEPEKFDFDKAKLEPIFLSQSISQLIRFLSRNIFSIQNSFKKMQTQVRKKDDLKKIRGKFLLGWDFPSIFGDKEGISLKIFEELLLDHLSLKKGLNKNEIQDSLGESRITARLNKFIEQECVYSYKLGKEIYYTLSLKGNYLLIPFTMMIYIISNINTQSFDPQDYFTTYYDDSGIDILLRNSQSFLRNLLAHDVAE